MAYKRKVDQKKAAKRIYEKNKSSYMKRNKKNKKEKLEFVDRVKKRAVCLKCGETRFYTLQFHHRKPSDKDGSIYKLANSGYSIETIKTEMRKCDIVCSNCHLEIHYEERLN